MLLVNNYDTFTLYAACNYYVKAILLKVNINIK
jgi:hypothetical protein